MRGFLLLIISALLPASALASVTDINAMKRIADRGNSYAQYEVGKYFCERGNRKEGLHYLQLACNGGTPQACEYLNKVGAMPQTQQDPEFNKLSPDEKFDFAYKNYNKKYYTSSFPIFKGLCNEQGHEPACFMLGVSYAMGNGTGVDSYKALDIFNQYYDRDDIFKLHKALVLEYNFGYDADNINKAMAIYNELLNSANKNIVQDAQKGLDRVPTYIFAGDFMYMMVGSNTGKINYENLVKLMSNIDLGKISPTLRDLFFKWRTPYLEIAKMNDSSLMDGLFLIGKSAVKGFLGDLSFVGDVIDHGVKAYKSGDTIDMIRAYQRKILEQLQNEGISVKYLDSFIPN